MSQTQNLNRIHENDERAYGREQERFDGPPSLQLDPRLFGARGDGVLGERERDPRQWIVNRLNGIEQERQTLGALLAFATGVSHQGYSTFGGGLDLLRNIDPRFLAEAADWQQRQAPSHGQRNQSQHSQRRNVRVATKGLNRDDNFVKDDVISEISHLIQHGRIDQDDLIEIDVRVKEGDVTLAGTVTSRDAKLTIESVVGSVIGVKDIRNELRFVPLALEGNNQRVQQRDPRQPHAS